MKRTPSTKGTAFSRAVKDCLMRALAPEVRFALHVLKSVPQRLETVPFVGVSLPRPLEKSNLDAAGVTSLPHFSANVCLPPVASDPALLS